MNENGNKPKVSLGLLYGIVIAIVAAHSSVGSHQTLQSTQQYSVKYS